MKAIERLFKYFEYKGIKPTYFEKKNGLSNGYLLITFKRKGDIGSKIVDIIIDRCSDLSQEWLMLGKGEMIKTNEYIEKAISIFDIQKENELLKIRNNLLAENINHKAEIIHELKFIIEELKKTNK